MIIITALVLGCLSAIFITTYSSVRNDLNTRLNGAVNMCINQVSKPPRMKPDRKPDFPQTEPRPDETPPEQTNKFRSDFAIYVDSDGNTLHADTNFNIEEKDYAGSVAWILTSDKETGSVLFGTDSWAFKKVPYKNGFILAFSQNASQKNILIRLAVILTVIALLSIGITFLISLFSANHSIKPIEESYNKQKQFVADASHELRTPLASISANTDVLLSHPQNTVAEERKWLEYIKDETGRMTQLTNDLLYLARSDSDAGESDFPVISLSDVVEDTVLESEAVAFEKKIELTYTISDSVHIKAPLNSAKQLALILIDNALKYAPEKGSVNAALEVRGDKAVFTVENTGTISAEDLPHIFERFYRADKSRARESGGYGLGLAIAESICKGLGGTISAFSEDNTTTFTVMLPLHTAP